MRHADRDVPGLLLGLTLLPLFFVRTAPAAVSSRVLSENGKRLVVIANDRLELTFEPARGGRCTRFVFKDTGEQIIGGAEVCGIFLDHWAKYPWPSGLMWLPYEHELLGDGTTQIGIRLWVKVPKMGGGKGDPGREVSSKMPTSPDLVGLVVRKTIWLRADTDLIRVEQEVANPTAESRAAALYVQHNVEVGSGRYGIMRTSGLYALRSGPRFAPACFREGRVARGH